MISLKSSSSQTGAALHRQGLWREGTCPSEPRVCRKHPICLGPASCSIESPVSQRSHSTGQAGTAGRPTEAMQRQPSFEKIKTVLDEHVAGSFPLGLKDMV